MQEFGTLATMELLFIVAICSNHGVWLPPDQEVYSKAWTSYDQPLALLYVWRFLFQWGTDYFLKALRSEAFKK